MLLKASCALIQPSASRYSIAQSGPRLVSQRLLLALILQPLLHVVRAPLGLRERSFVGGVAASGLGFAKAVGRRLPVRPRSAGGSWCASGSASPSCLLIPASSAFLGFQAFREDAQRGVRSALFSSEANVPFRAAPPRGFASCQQTAVSDRRGSASPPLRLLSSWNAAFFSSGAMSRLSEGDGWGGEGLHSFPENACGSLIFLHGLGDTASGWQLALRDMLSQLGLQSRVRLLLPTASRRPVTICGGKMHAWSDIFGLTKGAPEDKSGLLRSRDRIIALIEKEVAAGVSPKRIVVGGFSQGGAVAYLTALTMPFAVGGVLALSTWVPLGADLEISPAVSCCFPRVLHLHGGADEVVRAEYGRLSCESIRERLPQSHQHRVQFKEYPGMQHEASDEELKEAARFVKEVFTAEEQ